VRSVSADAAICAATQDPACTATHQREDKLRPRVRSRDKSGTRFSSPPRAVGAQTPVRWEDGLRSSSCQVRRTPKPQTPPQEQATRRRGRSFQQQSSPEVRRSIVVQSPDIRRSVIEIPPSYPSGKLRHFGPPGEVEERLWIGGMEDARPERVAEKGFDVVISLLRYTVFGGPPTYPPEVVCHNYPVVDNGTDLIPLEEIAGRINEGLQQGKCVLVHCKQGISRSASAVIGYLMVYRRMPLDQALQVVKKARPAAAPKFGKQLRYLEEQCKERWRCDGSTHEGMVEGEPPEEYVSATGEKMVFSADAV